MWRLFCLPTGKWDPPALSLFIIVMFSPVASSAVFGRTWKSSDGAYSVDAEFMESNDGMVSLRKVNGDVIHVPVSRLSAEDQAYVNERARAEGASSTSTAESSSPTKKRTFTQLVQAANRSGSASEVLRLYKTFVLDESVAEADRKTAEKQLALWEDRAKKRMVRVGSRWLLPAEARDQSLQVRQLTEEALQLIAVGQDKAAIDKCEKASRLDTGDIQGDYLAGLIYALLQCNAKEANRHFAECVSRNPDHIAALNNLALSEVRLKKYTQALAHWQTALELAPATPEAVQNLGRLLHLAREGGLRVPAGVQNRFADLYAAAALSAKAREFDSRIGWLYMGYYAPRGKQAVAAKNTGQGTAQPKAELITVGSGTGFVVYPEYILTNRHVVEGTAGLSVVPPGGQDGGLPASVVEVAEGPDDDLAVIRCKGLTAPPLAFITADLAPRGTEIMILGYPGVVSGARPSLKSTRGSISGLPDESFNAYALDAIVNPGNSGGPTCDATGSVLGITYALTAQLQMNYGLSIPHSRALPLLRKCIPGYERSPANTEIKQWSDVDGSVSPSVVLIWCQNAVSDPVFPKKKETKKTAQAMEDPWCMICNGSATVPCPNSDCNRGTISSPRKEFVSSSAFGDLYRTVYVRVPCNTCHGKGSVTCRACDRGIDRSLLVQSGKRRGG